MCVIFMSMTDLASDFIFAYTVHGHKYDTHVLVVAFIGLLLIACKYYVLRRAFLMEHDVWDQTLGLIYVDYAIFLLEDIPMITLLLMIVGGDPWSFWKNSVSTLHSHLS